ncbi:hypothetical protein [Actinoplanes sp. TFC3]|uniref:hypothetical protein n=1 Tax=Actinoplanes sp. TFC3 TaxID=1710355 RepID=UPI000ABDA0F6|nr:hypothetical protein [Actinoplanes sp. TFC3]
MRRSSRRAATRRGPDRRVIAAAAVLVAFGGVVGITQISNAGETTMAACSSPAPGRTAGAKSASDPKVGTYTDKDGDVQHKGDGQLAKGEQAPEPEPAGECKDGATVKKTVNGLEILTDTCEGSQFQPHDGFQNGDRCVSTEFGEVSVAAKNPSLLITEFPEQVSVGQPFTLKVSTRNLVRDRFLAAGQGGYYVESSVLTAEGLTRGHFHTACRMLASTSEAVDPSPVPAFFVATEDGKGNAVPDTVTIQVPGLPQEGIAQCASWAGDGSHRVPMMQRANETPAIDAVRVKVGAAAGGDNNDGNGDDNGAGGNNGGGNNGGGNNGGGNNGDNENGNGGGDNGDGGTAQPEPGASSDAPQTETGTTPPKAPTVSLPPAGKPGDQATGQAPEPVKTTAAPKPAKTGDAESASENKGDADKGDADKGDADKDDAGKDDAGKSDAGKSDEPAAEDEDAKAQNVTGKKASPKPSKTTAAAATSDDDEDTGAPDATQATVKDVAATPVPENKLALTGANVMAVTLGGAVLILAGLLVLSATRRRRAGGQ